MHYGVEAAFLREQAETCRHLAARLSDKAARQTLRSMAEGYEAKANELGGPLADGVPHPKLSSSEAP